MAKIILLSLLSTPQVSIHGLAELIWPPFVAVLEYGTAAYILGNGLIATLRDVLDFLILVLS